MDIEQILSGIEAGFKNEQISTSAIVTVLLVASALSIYEFLIYRFVSKRSFYVKQFNIALAVIPIFIATIIMALQSNIVITLGTIGALAIIRFRTAVKDPIDMLYLLWSVHNGIVCGTGLYEVGILTSIVATVLVLVLDILPLKKAPYLLVINAEDIKTETIIVSTIKEYSCYQRIKSRNITNNGLDMIIEMRTKHESELLEKVSKIPGVKNMSLVTHDGESVI